MDATQTKVTAMNFGDFILSRKLCVLYAQQGTALNFNKYLQEQLKDKYHVSLAMGELDLSKLNYKSIKITEFINCWIPNLGLPRTGAIFPGYYLFRDGKLIGYHPGTMDPKQGNPQADGLLALISLVGGVLVGLAEGASRGLQAFVDLMQVSIGFRVFEFFEDILKSNNSSYSRIRHQLVYEDELTRAYKLLKVNSQASDADVKTAFRKLMKEYHPDKSQKDYEARTKLAAEINNACDLIKASRAKSKSHTTV